MQFTANYYDGISPITKPVLVSIDASHFVLRFHAEHADDLSSWPALEYAIQDCNVQARLGRGKRIIDLPDDGRLETDFQALEQYLPKTAANTFWQAMHYAETHRFIILLALGIIVLVGWLLLQFGVPMLAKYAANATPMSIEKKLGEQTLKTLDEKKLGYVTPSTLSIARQGEISKALAALCNKTHQCPAYQLNFRNSPAIGANAFALPGGYVLLTDQLVAFANNDDEIIAVLTHELGHVKGRHAFRQILQGSLAGLIIIAITGDVSSMVVGLPAMMLNMRYTRDLENEADQYALTSMQMACIPTESFAHILVRLAQNSGAQATPEIIASHPDTKKRIQSFLNNAVTKQSHCI